MNISKNVLATEQFVLDNRTHYDDTNSGGEFKKLDNKYLNDNVVTCQSAEVGQIIVVKSVNENGTPIEWEAVKGQTSQNFLILKDFATNFDYYVYMNNGSLESCVKTKEIKVVALPLKTDYTDTELFDPTGIIVVSVDLNGNETEITDFTYDKYVITESNFHEIRYTNKFGVSYTTEIPITTRSLEDALQDFDYTTNDDGTYTITGWKQTLNGAPSTEMFVPNSPLVIV